MALVGRVLEETWRQLVAAVDAGLLADPRLFSVVVLTVVGFIGGRIVADLLRTLLQMTAVDDLAVKMDVQLLLREIGYRGALSDFVADLTRLLVYVLTVLAVFYLFGFEFILIYSDVLFAVFSTVLIASLLLLLGVRLSEYVEGLVVRVFRATRLTGARDEAEAEIPVYAIAGRITRYTGYLITVLVVLGVIGVAPPIMHLLVGIFGVGVVAVLVLSTRDLGRNIAASIYLQLSRVFRGGETVAIGDVRGEIVSIRPLYTKLEDGRDTLYVPNTRIVSSIVRQDGE